MKNRSLLLDTLLACSIAVLTLFVATGVLAQDKATKVSEAEGKAAKAVQSAPDANAKMAAAEAFIKKYPKSSLRSQVASYMGGQVFGEKDANQRVALAKKALAIFTLETEVNDLRSGLIDAYVELERFDEAFAEGATFLAKNPDNVQVLINLSIIGTEQAKKGKPQHLQQAIQYGSKAIELIEADKKPADMDVETWNRNKARLPQLYQGLGIISMMQRNSADAKAKVEKAAQLSPADPLNYVVLSSMANEEYATVAETYKKMPEGKAKQDLLVQANQMMDKVIDYYAHAVALSEGKPQYQKLHDQSLEDMTPYYKYRHGGSLDGLQKLIDGYKLP